MRRMMTAGVVGLAVTGLAAPAQANHPELTSYDELRALAADWQRRGAEVTNAGTTRGGREILRVRIGRGPITLLMTNVLHANEPSGTEAFVRFAELLLGNPEPSVNGDRLPGVQPHAALLRHLSEPAVRNELLRRVSVVGFPMMDPDGVERGHVRDQLTNIDYTTRVTPQAAAIGAAFRELEPDLLLDSHGGPNEPDLNIGYIKPEGVEPAIAAAGSAAARIAWRAADALGIRLAYFEEHPFALVAGQHEDPFLSADQAYYDAITGVAPVTHASYALEGLPVLYTETVGLQSTDPSVSILQGASAQEVTMAGLALAAAGLTDGTRPGKVVADPRSGPLRLHLPAGAHDLLAVVHWGRGVAEDPSGPRQDYELVLRGADGRELGRSGGPAHATRRSRAVAVAQADGAIAVEATPDDAALADGAVLRVTWRAPEPGAARTDGVLGDPARVAYCLREQSLWDMAAPGFRGPACDAQAAERPPVAAPPSSPARRCESRRRFTIRVSRPRRGRLRGARVHVDGRRVRVRRRGGRLIAVVDLRGRPPGQVTVRIVATTTRGRFTTLRRYRTCARRG